MMKERKTQRMNVEKKSEGLVLSSHFCISHMKIKEKGDRV